MVEAASLKAHIEVDADQAQRKIENFGVAFDKVAARVARGFVSGVGIGAGVAAFELVEDSLQGIASGMANVVGAGLKMNAGLEQAQVGLTAMLGTTQAADAHLRELFAFAAKTPFEIKGVLQESQRLQAMGFTAQQVVPMLESIGNAAAASGERMFENFGRISLAIAQMNTRGKVSTQELNQLTEAGVQAWDILAQATGRPKEELSKLVEQGKIASATFIPMFQEFTKQKFGDLMEAQSKTAIGAFNNLKDAIGLASGQALQPLSEMVRNVIVGFVEFTKSAIKN